jgi:hypothetical protein
MEQAPEVVRGGVRLPCTGRRNYQSYSKLLKRVDPQATSGFDFEGQMLRSGTVVTDAQLRPSDEWPAMPVLLEFVMVMVEQGKLGRKRAEQQYVLWRFDGYVWIELGRAQSPSWQWAIDLRELAVRALAQGPEVMPDLAAVQARIAAAIARELEGLEGELQSRVLGIVHDQIACRVAAIGARSPNVLPCAAPSF